MPTYDYECKSCGHTFEMFQSMSDEPIKTCPLCKKEVRRLIGGGLGVIFKGNGFYVTDSKKSSQTTGSPKKETPKEKEASPAPVSETKGDNKEEKKDKPKKESVPA